jgi:simple sugar transport system permease protein
VIGGVTLSGGFGSPVGTLFAAFLFGVVSEGFFFTNINEVWYEAFVGVMLLAAIVINKYSGDLTMRIWDRRQAPSEAR